MTSATEHIVSSAAVASTAATLVGWLQGNVAFLASLLSIAWLLLQMVIAVQNQIDRRRIRRLQAVQDVHTMRRADAVTAALETKPVVPVVVVPEPLTPPPPPK